MEEIFGTTRKLTDVIRNMQTCLQCTICLHTITEPVKTSCGHRFCRTCIKTVLQNKNALCPLCNTAIQRRSITTDEDMKVYIVRMQELIEAIQMDSGIDISSELGRLRCTEGNLPVDTASHFNQDPEESNRPSCSKAVTTPKKRDAPPTSPRKRKEKNEKRDSASSDIRMYLKKYSMSGVEPLSDGTMNDRDEDEDDKNSKVHSWLNTLPNSEALIHPDKIDPEEGTEYNLDDTLTISVSQNCKDNKPDDYEAEGVRQCQSPLRVSLANNAGGNETGSENSKTVLVEDPANPRPGTSGITRANEEQKERSNDVQRTSPCDMLPGMKKNWSSVARFGKEMRTKKKKLKSLNVSKSRSYEESADEGTSKAKGTRNKSTKRTETESNVSLSVSKPVRDRLTSTEKDSRRCESRKEPEASANIANGVDDPRNLDKSLANVQERRKSVEESIGRKETRSNTPVNIVGNVADASVRRYDLDVSSPRTEHSRVDPAENSNEVRIIRESSFIELGKGEHVHIKELNSRQMNDIIGITRETVGDRLLTATGNDAVDNRDQMDNSLPLKKRRNLPSTPPCDRSGLPGQTTPTKLPTDKYDQSLCDTVNDSASKCQSAKSRGRLSLARRSTDPKPNDSSGPDYASRLQAAKRDLNRQMDASLDLSNDAAPGKSSGDKQRTTENVRRTVRPALSKIENKGDASMVKFKKLGKVFKHRKKRVRFLYLGSTRSKRPVGGNYPELKPCNLVDYLDTQCFAVPDNFENVFGNNLLITVNDSSPLAVNNHEDASVQKVHSVAQDKRASEDVMCLDMERKDDKEPAASVDVVFVSLNGNESRHEEPAKAFDNAVPKSPVHLMSPPKVPPNVSFESPTNCIPKTSKYSHAESVIISDQRKDFEVKGAHSRALIRRTQQTLASSDTDSTCDSATKRKRPKDAGWIDKNIQRMRRMSLINDADSCESDHSFSSRITCVRKRNSSDNETVSSKNDNIPLSKPSTRCVDSMSVSSGSDVDIGRSNADKKAYRRIMPVVSSDADSPNLPILNKDLQSPPSKRKRMTSPDSDCEVELEALVKDWCDDPIIDRNKNNLKQPSTRPDRQEASSRTSSFTFNAAIRSQRRQVASNLVSEERSNAVQMNEDSPDFAATIDKIQHIRNSTMTSQSKDTMQKGDEVTMMENLNDVMMDFDTNAFDEYLEAQGIKPASKQVNPGEQNEPAGSSSLRPLNRNVMLAHRSNSSDKENKYKGGRLSQMDSDNEVTFIDDLDRVSKRIDGVKSFEQSGDRAKMNSGLDKSSTRNAITSDNEKHADGLRRRDDDVPMKDMDYEQDSLMDVTQHYLLIKQFENDLFGKPLCSNNSYEFKGQEQKTPQKVGNKSKDNEHSAEEDDIVENTPDTKTKNVRVNNACRENSTASSVNINDRHLRTPSSVTIASTPCSKRSLHPLYQSTPKSQLSKIKPTITQDESCVRRAREPGTTNNRNEQKLSFVCSGLVAAQVNQVEKLAQSVNASYSTQFNEQVTHVIVKVNEENNGANKTLKYLQGIAHRKWIVAYQWVLDSLKEKKLVDEERYEAVDCSTLEAGPRNSRLRTKNLFEGFVFLCIGPYVDVSVDQYRDLLRATGAKVVDSLDALITEKSKLKIIVIQSDVHDYEIIEWYQKARAVPIVHDWVVECISQYRLISFYPYLQELSRHDVLALGYPEFLVEEELDGDSDSASNATV